MAEDDPICTICNERKSLHVATAKGPYTHPREARGEGFYVAQHGTLGGFYPQLDDLSFTRWVFKEHVTPEPHPAELEEHISG